MAMSSAPSSQQPADCRELLESVATLRTRAVARLEREAGFTFRGTKVYAGNSILAFFMAQRFGVIEQSAAQHERARRRDGEAEAIAILTARGELEKLEAFRSDADRVIEASMPGSDAPTETVRAMLGL